MESKANVPKGRHCELPVESIIISDGANPRITFEEKLLFGLGKSIKEVGQVQDVVVNCVEGKFHLIAGERRVRAAKMAGVQFIEAKVFDELDGLMVLDMKNAENDHVPLNHIESARMMQQYIDYGKSEKELADKFDITIDTVRRKLNLLKLTQEVQDMISRDINPLPVHQALMMVKLPASDQLKMARWAAPITGPVKSEDDVKQAIDARSGQKNLPIDHADPADKHPSMEQAKRAENQRGTLPGVKTDAKKSPTPAHAEKFGPFDVTVGIKGKIETSRLDGEVLLKKATLTFKIKDKVEILHCDEMPLSFDNEGKTLAAIMKFLKKVSAKKAKEADAKKSR
jgi:ParB/RepB/Spo0J family partition protein